MSIKPQRENSGILFKNDRKTEDGPDYVGELNVAGADYLLSAWIKQGPKSKFMSLALTAKDTAQPQRTYAQRRDDLGDEKPF